MNLILQNPSLFSETEKTDITKFGFTIISEDSDVNEAEVYVGIFKDTRLKLETIKGLKFIQSTIAGYDMIDMDAIKAKNISFANASGIGSAPIAEFIVHALLDKYRCASLFRESQGSKTWISRRQSDAMIDELTHKRILILGTGSIGHAVAKRLSAFDAVCVGINQSGRTVEYFDACYPMNQLDAQLQHADVVVGALPLNDDSRNLYNEQFFKKMKNESIFINVGRGPQCNEDDLLTALDQNIAHAILDVFQVEPLSSESKLWTHPHIVVTPHNSSSSLLVEARLKALIMHNLKQYAEKQMLRNQVF